MSSQDANQQDMFSEAEHSKLQSFLNELETFDTDHSNKKRKEKNKASPYSKTRSPSIESRSSGRARKPAHELLSEEQKKANHIASEQKRRANIRIGFDQLVNIVPALDSCHRSESLILQKSVDYIRGLIQDKQDLLERVRELQTILGEVPDEDSSEGEADHSFARK